MSLQSNANVDHDDGLPKAEDEGQSITLTEKVDKGIKYFFSRFQQKLPTKIINDLANEEKLDIFKYLDFNQLLTLQKTNRYFNSFINEYKNELARDYFNIKILQLAVSERIPLFLSFNDSREADILLHKHHLTKEENSKKLNRNMFLDLPLFPKNIEEMCIIRYWLDKLFRCGYKEAEFYNVIFNPVLIKLLFENEVKELNTKQTSLRYCIEKFENEALKFVKDHLKIFDKFSVGFSLNDDNGQCNGIILNILNEGAKFPYVCITSCLHPSILELIKNKITTSTNCSSLVPKIEFTVDNLRRVWDFNYLHNREGVKTKRFITKCGLVKYSSSYEIANIENPNIVFSINYVCPGCISWMDFKIERK